jgi:hypothetical protein
LRIAGLVAFADRSKLRFAGAKIPAATVLSFFLLLTKGLTNLLKRLTAGKISIQNYTTLW